MLEKQKRQIAVLHDSLHTLKVTGSLHPIGAQHAGDPALSGCPTASIWKRAEVATCLQQLKQLASIQGQKLLHVFCLYKACAVQQKYTQAERGHAALDEELTRGYIHNLEVHASQQERVGHYRKNEQAKREKVRNASSVWLVGGTEFTVRRLRGLTTASADAFPFQIGV